MAIGRASFLSEISSFALALACTTRQLSTSWKGSSGRQNSMPTRRPLAQPGVPQIKAYTAYSSSPLLVQRSPWFEGFRAKHRLREQDTDNRRGQPFARNSTGVCGRPFGRSTSAFMVHHMYRYCCIYTYEGMYAYYTVLLTFSVIGVDNGAHFP